MLFRSVPLTLNLLHEFSVSGTTLTKVKSSIWGLDWSGTLQGAGGVGGLLYHNDLAAGVTMLPAYDGSGNVAAMLKRSDGSGTIVAAYEYDAYGNTLRATGPQAQANPFRYSTKYTDAETGLVYHETRYYSPSLGRFINRDSIGEQGGLNLYAYVSNRVPNAWDYLGQNPIFLVGLGLVRGVMINAAMGAATDILVQRYIYNTTWSNISKTSVISSAMISATGYSIVGAATKIYHARNAMLAANNPSVKRIWTLRNGDLQALPATDITRAAMTEQAQKEIAFAIGSSASLQMVKGAIVSTSAAETKGKPENSESRPANSLSGPVDNEIVRLEPIEVRGKRPGADEKPPVAETGAVTSSSVSTVSARSLGPWAHRITDPEEIAAFLGSMESESSFERQIGRASCRERV